MNLIENDWKEIESELVQFEVRKRFIFVRSFDGFD